MSKQYDTEFVNELLDQLEATAGRVEVTLEDIERTLGISLPAEAAEAEACGYSAAHAANALWAQYKQVEGEKALEAQAAYMQQYADDGGGQ